MVEYPLMEVTILCWTEAIEEPDNAPLDQYDTAPMCFDFRRVVAICPCDIDLKETTSLYLENGFIYRVLAPFSQMRDAWNAAITVQEQRNLLTNNQ